jgi:hypothetical protein
VADTRLGRLATAICFDMNFPELFRAYALRGAEVLLHPTAEPHNVRRRAWENGRQVRAWENTMYVASAALGGEYWNGLAPDPATLFSRGHSKLVNFDGTVQSVADGPGPVPLGGADRPARAARGARRRDALPAALGRAGASTPRSIRRHGDDPGQPDAGAGRSAVSRAARRSTRRSRGSPPPSVFVAPRRAAVATDSLASGGL